MDILCVCDELVNHNCITRHQMKCCGAMFEKTCVTNFINILSWYPYCGEEARLMKEQLYSFLIPPPNTME